MNNETIQLADYLGQMIRQATVETIRHIVGEEAASDATNSLRSIPLPGGDTEPADTEPEPVPDWPTAALLWHNGRVWARSANGSYLTQGDHWHATYMDGANQKLRDGARRFAREAVPAVVVPAAEWEAFRASAARRECHRTEAELIDAADALGAGEQ